MSGGGLMLPGRDLQPWLVAEFDDAPQEHARGAQHSGVLLPAPWGGPLGRKMPATGTAVLVCSTVEFSLEYLNPLLGIRGSGSLTNASTLRVKLF